jgi:hypothetical protein
MRRMTAVISEPTTRMTIQEDGLDTSTRNPDSQNCWTDGPLACLPRDG